MNTKTKMMIQRTKVFVSVALISLLWSCGNNGSEKSTETNAPAATETSSVDDGQGVGKFHDVTLGAIDHGKAVKGKAVFEAKCFACHRATNQKIVGPGLLGITQKQKPAWILNMITNPQEMTQKDPTAKKLLAEHLVQMTFQDVSDEQAMEILEYFRENDATNAQASK